MGRAIMVQGTASGVGKSILVTALCRLFAQEGYRVSPFKAQNMSLNATVTPDGREIAWAQYIQALAARAVPSADMNPILLKPEAGSRCQVIVHGRVVGSFSAREYPACIREMAQEAISSSLKRLLSTSDVVVIEGAGSPAEVNLRERDLANMAVAAMADAPVLLVADIDRGGALAALVGTMELLPPEEKRRVVGVVINRFRGDADLLTPAISFLQETLGVPVVGVLPYLPGLALGEEDSQTQPRLYFSRESTVQVDVVVVDLPHLANSTDFLALATEPGVRLRFVRPEERIGPTDLIVLPGTKTTIADLKALRATGMVDQICAARTLGIPLVGICGGFQMLGRSLHDPDGVEGSLAQAEGLGLLPLETVFQRGKVTVQVEAEVITDLGPFAGLRGMRVRGYEIHTGRSGGKGQSVFRICEEGAREEGMISPDGLVWGTYLHGLFENPPLRQALISWVASRKGLRLDLLREGEPAMLETSFERLAEAVWRHLDVVWLFRVLGLVPPTSRRIFEGALSLEKDEGKGA
ncbi:MAG: cobyric acid synthase [Armatimonadota bacterium]|nr:cobyric acid synthase [Armatimonadota bacterium]